MPKPGKKLDEKQVDQHLEAYTEKAAGELLDKTFGKWDEIKDESKVVPMSTTRTMTRNGW